METGEGRRGGPHPLATFVGLKVRASFEAGDSKEQEEEMRGVINI